MDWWTVDHAFERGTPLWKSSRRVDESTDILGRGGLHDRFRADGPRKNHWRSDRRQHRPTPVLSAAGRRIGAGMHEAEPVSGWADVCRRGDSAADSGASYGGGFSGGA